MKVQWSEDARRDIAEIAAYVSRTSERRALAVLNKLEAAAKRLDRNEERGRVVPELARLGIDRWRELIVRPWRIVYRPMRGSVRIYAVLDGRRNIDDLLIERLLRTAAPRDEV